MVYAQNILSLQNLKEWITDAIGTVAPGMIHQARRWIILIIAWMYVVIQVELSLKLTEEVNKS